MQTYNSSNFLILTPLPPSNTASSHQNSGDERNFLAYCVLACFQHLRKNKSQSVNNSYSELNPLTCRIRICFTIVLFPDSPAPKRERRKGKTLSYMLQAGGIGAFIFLLFCFWTRQHLPPRQHFCMCASMWLRRWSRSVDASLIAQYSSLHYIFHSQGSCRISPLGCARRPGGLGLLPPARPGPHLCPLLLTQQQQAVCRFISQPLFLQLLLYFFVGFSLRFLIDTLILRFAVAQTPHSRCSGWMSNRCLHRFSIYKGEEVGGRQKTSLYIRVCPCDDFSPLLPTRLARIKWSLAAFRSQRSWLLRSPPEMRRAGGRGNPAPAGRGWGEKAVQKCLTCNEREKRAPPGNQPGAALRSPSPPRTQSLYFSVKVYFCLPNSALPLSARPGNSPAASPSRREAEGER